MSCPSVLRYRQSGGRWKREHWMTDSAPSLRNSLGYGLKASGHTQAGLASSSPLLVLHSIKWKKEMPYFSKLQEKGKEMEKNKLVRLFHLIRRCFKTQSFWPFLSIIVSQRFFFCCRSCSFFFPLPLWFVYSGRLVWACYKASEESFEVFGPWRASQRCCTVHIEFEKFSSPGKKNLVATFYVSSQSCLDCLKGNISRNITDFSMILPAFDLSWVESVPYLKTASITDGDRATCDRTSRNTDVNKLWEFILKFLWSRFICFHICLWKFFFCL